MRGALFAAAAALVLGATGQACATTYIADFEDGTVGSLYNFTGALFEHLGPAGVIAGDASGKYMQFGGSGPGEYFAVSMGSTFLLPDGVRAQRLATLQSFDIMMPGGGKFWTNVYGSIGLSAGVWTHISSPFFASYGAVIVPTVGGPTFIDNVVFEESVSSRFVPEPATWMMMIAGFGLTGMALRRRRAVFA